MTDRASLRPGSVFLWRLVSLAVRVYYRVERVGAAAPDGPLVLVANHPNTLLDPSLIQATAGRQVRFLAKSTLFRGHVLSPLIRRSGSIPVYRRIDAGVDTSRNMEMFAAVEAALAAGEAICLFPEGISHVSGRLAPLRTGAARMVLASAAAGHPVRIMPVGLNFDRLPMFRSRVVAMFGAPFAAADLIDGYRAAPEAAVRTLTERIAGHLRRRLVEANPRGDLPLVARIDRLYASARGVSRDPAERVRRRQLIAQGIERLRRDDPSQYAAVLDDLRLYDEQRRAFGLRDQDLDRRMPARDVARFLLREGSRALVLGPLALVGLLCFAPAYWLTWIVSRWAPDLQSRATWQVVGGAIIYALWIGTLAAVAGWRAGVWTGVGVALLLPPLAFVGLTAFEREAAALRLVRAFLASRQTPLRARARLRRQRAALATVLEQVRDWLETPPAGGAPGAA